MAGRAAALAIVLAVAACSTADYGKPVHDFAAATGDARASLAALDAGLADSFGAVLESRIVSGRAFVTAAPGECQTASQRCRLAVTTRDGKTDLYPPEPPLATMTEVMAGIDAYAGNLAAVVEADTAEQAQAQVDAALGSIENLAQTVASASGGAGQPMALGQFATPAGEAANWLVGQYVERVKFRGLQRATATAKPVVEDAARLFATTATFASDVPNSLLAEQVSQALDAFRGAGSQANYDRLAQAAAAYDAVLTAAPPKVFERMAQAHDALADALNGQGITLPVAIARIEAFAAEAKKLAAILKDFHAAAVPAGG